MKTSSIRIRGEAECDIRVLDGFCNVLPFGVTRRTQTELSTLLDAYKQAERVAGLPAGIFTLEFHSDRSRRALRGAEGHGCLEHGPGRSGGFAIPKTRSRHSARAPRWNPSALSEANEGHFWFIRRFRWPPGGQQVLVHRGRSEPGAVAGLPSLLGKSGQGISPAAIEADIDAGTRAAAATGRRCRRLPVPRPTAW